MHCKLKSVLDDWWIWRTVISWDLQTRATTPKRTFNYDKTSDITPWKTITLKMYKKRYWEIRWNRKNNLHTITDIKRLSWMMIILLETIESHNSSRPLNQWSNIFWLKDLLWTSNCKCTHIERGCNIFEIAKLSYLDLCWICIDWGVIQKNHKNLKS